MLASYFNVALHLYYQTNCLANLANAAVSILELDGVIKAAISSKHSVQLRE